MEENCITTRGNNIVNTMDLLENAESLRALTSQELDKQNQAERGQFFTPLLVAKILAELPKLPDSGTFRVLDPGAGSGILSAAIAERIYRQYPDLEVEITAIENDPVLLKALKSTLHDIESKTTASTQLLSTDFIQWALTTNETFDLIIQNPPYKKLAAKSNKQKLLRSNNIKVPNVYAAFMTLGLHLLRSGGQQVSITPRSWMNGAYFEEFRKEFISTAGIDAIYTFGSRSRVFKDTGVLQESIIVSATKSEFPKNVAIHASYDHLSEPTVRIVSYDDVVTPDFIYVPVTTDDLEAVAWITKNASCTLKDLGLMVSTGKVVDFRSKDNLQSEPGNGAVPFIHLSHLNRGTVCHPIHPRKPEWFIANSDKTQKMLVEGGTYVLIKRFSTKEEQYRITAGIWESSSPVAFGNKVNFIHDNGLGLDPEIAKGLVVFLSSTQLDRYFRVFSGHTQVNATDLRQMRFPTADQLRALAGVDIENQESIDQAVQEIVVGV